ncbi:hypothetical protein C2869_08165 [Saccharobesus litoralis]|uniref:Phosphate ABC transporter substrate-binding protein n=1 Tax=Saccharobesus litoralis TaxID=2172099 RepID=A0A2S0VQC1_9ALTE|nr:hypothetical protein [Saccharobesus litoralis]AWB66404.1 hypothetical protein C2869_08165 [Saccharobesus litoralis]
MTKWLFIIALLTTSASASLVSASSSSPIVIVVGQDNPTPELSRMQVIDMYMGKYVAFPNGEIAIPIDINDDSLLRSDFYQALVGMSLARVNSYWSRIKFTGRAKPPIEKSNEQAIIDYIANTPNAIGYIRKENLTNNLKVIYQFNE